MTLPAAPWATLVAEPLWLWAALGLVLAIAELLAPGYCLMWLAAAALLTALASGGLGLGLPAGAVVFAVLAPIAVLLARRWMAAHPAPAGARVNDRAAELVGQVVVVTQPIADGSGRVRLGDGEWLARGPDAVAGTALRIAAVDGTVLVVERAH